VLGVDLFQGVCRSVHALVMGVYGTMLSLLVAAVCIGWLVQELLVS
jgi:hypothetical protein